MPGLNCYSCPGAVGSCPIGSLQAVITSREHKFTFYVLGFLLLFGALFGRLVCGWLCPLRLVQDLLHKIPFVKKLRRLPGERVLRCLKYAVLVCFVVILPLTVLDIVGQGQPWFCKYICPSGTLFAGIPLIAANPPLRAALGWLFTWKAAILIVLVLLSIVLWRPFCRYLCPLGAIYGCLIRSLSTGSVLIQTNAPPAAPAKGPASWILQSTARPTARNVCAAATVGDPARTERSVQPIPGPVRPEIGRLHIEPAFPNSHKKENCQIMPECDIINKANQAF